MKCDELEIGKSAIIEVGDKEIALFNYKGNFYAIDNTCPHRGAPLGEGRIEEGILICPNHEWRFDGVRRIQSLARRFTRLKFMMKKFMSGWKNQR